MELLLNDFNFGLEIKNGNGSGSCGGIFEARQEPLAQFTPKKE
ncbi:hypothetical protein [Coxiella-like endosymbiont of Rhipicephalus sanguineus]|nr:hypothetical protein [Coxiella-like endosymbiont of Rhipicephalus sanguineus]